MYIVKRGFRNLGVMLTVGTEITDPTVIKHFKSRLGAGDIIVVTEQNYDTCKAFFQVKYGVTLNDFHSDVVPDAKTETTSEAAVAADIIYTATSTVETKTPVKTVAKATATTVNKDK